MDLVGFEPTTSSMPFPYAEYIGRIANEFTRYRGAVFMRAGSIFPALQLYPSDSNRDFPIRVGMRGLRHKLRHKFRGSGPKACFKVSPAR